MAGSLPPSRRCSSSAAKPRPVLGERARACNEGLAGQVQVLGDGARLHARYGRPVLELSRNVFASESAGAPAERAEADEAMSRFVSPLRFVALLTPCSTTMDGCGGRSIEIRQRVGREGPASTYDEWHYNGEAGAPILESLLAVLDAAFAKSLARKPPELLVAPRLEVRGLRLCDGAASPEAKRKYVITSAKSSALA